MKKLSHKHQLSRIWNQYSKMVKKRHERNKSRHRYGKIVKAHHSWNITGAWEELDKMMAEYKASTEEEASK